MNSRDRFLVAFPFLGLLMKVIGEVVHEVMGHGFFVLLFGGRIGRVHISLLWPYELSSITHEPPQGGFEAWQLVWIDGGGILVCLLVSFVFQGLLLLNAVRDWRLATSLLWLSFWTFLNPSGYLVVGAIRPFGDVDALIAQGALTQATSLLLGMTVFVAAFFSISRILINLLFELELIRSSWELRISLTLFWLVIPVAAVLSCLGMSLSLLYLQIFALISFIPVLAGFVLPSIQMFVRHTKIVRPD